MIKKDYGCGPTMMPGKFSVQFATPTQASRAFAAKGPPIGPKFTRRRAFRREPPRLSTETPFVHK
jgi:hypothetical protein